MTCLGVPVEAKRSYASRDASTVRSVLSIFTCRLEVIEDRRVLEALPASSAYLVQCLGSTAPSLSQVFTGLQPFRVSFLDQDLKVQKMKRQRYTRPAEGSLGSYEDIQQLFRVTISISCCRVVFQKQ